MNEQAKKATKRTRRWLKVSLRTFLLAITVLCVWLGFIVNRANKQKQAVAWVRENGGIAYYDFEWDDETGNVIENEEPPGPYWLREWMGIDYFAEVSFVYFASDHIADISPLSSLTDLRVLGLNYTQVADLSPLSKMTQLQSLDIAETQVSDLSPLTGMTDMRDLDLEGTTISDLSPLSGMKSMEQLYLQKTSVSELLPLTGMTKLRFLDLCDCQVSDLSPLMAVNGLQGVNLQDTKESDLSPLLGLKQLKRIWLSRDQKVTIPPELEPLIRGL